ncbi:Malonyl-CoA:anthocyanidin 5-O-glucoside-6''-O-malonyltransferase [Linum perenne]
MTTRVIEICHVSPSSPPATDFTLPLTFFDTFWLKFPPVEQIYFYRFPSLSMSPPDVIIHRLKRSLSLALRHFLPLAGKLTWPEHAEIPLLLYTPNDGVSLTIAESTEDNFDLLSGDGPHDASLSHAYVPKLVVSGSNAAVLALQVTVFRQGFCVGVTSHHAVIDGKSAVIFMKAWAYVSKELGDGAEGGELTEGMTPFVDRTVVKDPDGIALDDVKIWMAMNSKQNNRTRSLELISETVPACTRSNQEIKKLDHHVLDGAKGKLGRFVLLDAHKREGLVGVGVAGSPQFGAYGVNFGFGRPEKVEITSIDRTSAMSIMESGDGSGGVEVGVVMSKCEMEKFAQCQSMIFGGHVSKL